MSDAILGFGTRFYLQATVGAAALTKVAEVTSVTPPNEQVAEVEVTHYESPGRTREFIAGLNDAGDMSFEINWVPGNATDSLIATAKADGLVRTMRIVTPAIPGTPGSPGQQFTFPGFVRGFERGIPIDDKMTATITVRVAGAVVQAAAVANPTVIS